MPAKDIYHDNCKQALINEGWTITHDPYNLKVGRKDLFIGKLGLKPRRSRQGCFKNGKERV